MSINNVFLRITNVLCNVLKGRGSNDLVERTVKKKQKDTKMEKAISTLHKKIVMAMPTTTTTIISTTSDAIPSPTTVTSTQAIVDYCRRTVALADDKDV